MSPVPGDAYALRPLARRRLPPYALRLDLNLEIDSVRRLTDIRPGERACLAEVGGERSFRRRLMELGFLPGTPVRVVRRVPVGDLVELEVRGGYISLRASEADALLFENER